MKNRTVWLTISMLIAGALLLASCAPPPPATQTPTQTPTPGSVLTPTPAPVSGPEMVRDSLGRLVEKPEYGGELTFIYDSGPVGFDDTITQYSSCSANPLIYNDLVDGDWAKGPSGTSEASWLYGGFSGFAVMANDLIGSWELNDPLTVTMRVRKGVHFQNKPPVNGREMTADDIVFSVTRAMTIPTSKLKVDHPWGFQITAPDKWTVVLKSTEPMYTGENLRDVACMCYIVPREMVEKYGNVQIWENACGTGPFILVDHVPQSTLTLHRNPNYFKHDPLHPENQLPYVDVVKWLVIPDPSTRLAAMRTDKADHMGGAAEVSLPTQDARALLQNNPTLKSLKFLSNNANNICMRVDKPELPFDDIRVRQALMMAIDRQSIVKDYFSGEAEILTWPCAATAETGNFYVPLEKLPASVRELYSYNPEKAKKLLAEAGYPNGFKTQIVCYSYFIDMLSIVKDYWSKIGVDLTLDVKEYSVWTSIKKEHNHKEMYMNSRGGLEAPFKMLDLRFGEMVNLSMVNDPICARTYEAVANNFFNETERDRIFREFLPYCLEQAWYVQFPTPLVYTVWEPWVKSYNGEWSVGYSSRPNWQQYVWVDQDLRQQMTGRR